MQALSCLITLYADLLTQADASAASRISLEQDSVLPHPHPFPVGEGASDQALGPP